MEKRRYERIGGKRFMVDISDGSGFFSGTVTDFSRFGLQLDDIPKRLDVNVKKVSLIVQDKNSNFKISARPRWAENKTISKKVGFEIIRASWGWAEFVKDNEDPDKKPVGEIYI